MMIPAMTRAVTAAMAIARTRRATRRLNLNRKKPKSSRPRKRKQSSSRRWRRFPRRRFLAMTISSTPLRSRQLHFLASPHSRSRLPRLLRDTAACQTPRWRSRAGRKTRVTVPFAAVFAFRWLRCATSRQVRKSPWRGFRCQDPLRNATKSSLADSGSMKRARASGACTSLRVTSAPLRSPRVIFVPWRIKRPRKDDTKTRTRARFTRHVWIRKIQQWRGTKEASRCWAWGSGRRRTRRGKRRLRCAPKTKRSRNKRGKTRLTQSTPLCSRKQGPQTWFRYVHPSYTRPVCLLRTQTTLLFFRKKSAVTGYDTPRRRRRPPAGGPLPVTTPCRPRIFPYIPFPSCYRCGTNSSRHN
mmetsp:Transcript_6036/g.22817  ORF Transcript_6036/g.22817 Transcript_6036/m.22817 type:complete len:356 (-) Transcript_6036:363-1430(-)